MIFSGAGGIVINSYTMIDLKVTQDGEKKTFPLQPEDFNINNSCHLHKTAFSSWESFRMEEVSYTGGLH